MLVFFFVVKCFYQVVNAEALAVAFTSDTRNVFGINADSFHVSLYILYIRFIYPFDPPLVWGSIGVNFKLQSLYKDCSCFCIGIYFIEAAIYAINTSPKEFINDYKCHTVYAML